MFTRLRFDISERLTPASIEDEVVFLAELIIENPAEACPSWLTLLYTHDFQSSASNCDANGSKAKSSCCVELGACASVGLDKMDVAYVLSKLEIRCKRDFCPSSTVSMAVSSDATVSSALKFESLPTSVQTLFSLAGLL
jgi:hypothetical protein